MADLGGHVVITSTANPRVKWVRALQAHSGARAREGAFVLEGDRLAREAIGAQIRPLALFHTEQLTPRRRGLVNSLQRLGVEAETVSQPVMRAMSDTENPPGLLIVLPQPQLPAPSQRTLLLVADRIADPGNLGTLLRTSEAAGAQAVWLTQGSVDPFNPKVVRSAAGAHLRLPIRVAPATELLADLGDLDVWVAQARQGTRYDQVSWDKPVALVVGSEAAGPDPAFRLAATGMVNIPLPQIVDSLNASIAAAIILFEIARQRGHP